MNIGGDLLNGALAASDVYILQLFITSTLGSRKLPSFTFPGHFPLASSGLHVFGQNDGKSSGGDRRWGYAKGKLLEIMDVV